MSGVSVASRCARTDRRVGSAAAPCAGNTWRGRSAAWRRSARPHGHLDAGPRRPPSSRSALRLGEKPRCVAQDRVGALELAILTLEILEPLALLGRQRGTTPLVALRLPNPAPQRSGRAAQFLRHRANPRPLWLPDLSPARCAVGQRAAYAS